jgi:hypothetical protein
MSGEYQIFNGNPGFMCIDLTPSGKIKLDIHQRQSIAFFIATKEQIKHLLASYAAPNPIQDITEAERLALTTWKGRIEDHGIYLHVYSWGIEVTDSYERLEGRVPQNTRISIDLDPATLQEIRACLEEYTKERIAP